MPTPDATSESERERLDRRRSQYDPEQPVELLESSRSTNRVGASRSSRT